MQGFQQLFLTLIITAKLIDYLRDLIVGFVVLSNQRSIFKIFSLPIIKMNSSAYVQSREQITEMMSAKLLLQGTSGLREIHLEGVKDVSCVQVFNDTLYVGTNDSKVCVFEISKAKSEEQELVAASERSFYPHCTKVHFIVASSLLLIAVPLEEQQLIRIWNRQSLQILHGYKGHAKQITSVIFLKDKQHIASSSYDATVRIWKISQKFEFDLEMRKYTGKYPLLTLVQLDEQSVAFGGDDCFITIWNWNLDIVKYKCFAHPGSVISLSMSHPYIYSMGGDSRIRIWKQQENLRIVDMLNQEIKPIDQKMTLTSIKEFNQTVAQNVYPLHLGNHEVLAIDCKGNTFLITRHLDAITSRLKLDYSESIRSAKLWEHRLLVVVSRRGKGELKEIGGEFQQMMQKTNIPRSFAVITKTAQVDIRSKHSIAVQSDSSYKELNKPQFIVELDS